MTKRQPRLPILYEDDDILVVDKPAGLLTIPSGPGRGGVEDTLLGRVREYVGHGGRRRPYVGVLHRLDRYTSGALAFALTPEAHATARAMFAAHRFERHYLALVHGVLRSPQGTITAPIASRYANGRRGIARRGEPARAALTRYTVLEQFSRAALVALELATGRQHQIRAHLEHLGHPVVGDTVYSSGASRVSARRTMLHAWKLAFPHPLLRARIAVEADPPDDFLATLDRFARGRGPSRR